MNGYLRIADENDLDLLFEWVNDEDVRKSAFSTARIDYEEHKKWYGRLLKNSESIQYIYMNDKEAVGQVRVDICGDIGEIDYSISKEKRAMGYGKQMLELLREQIRTDFPQVRKLTAKVKPENIASQKAFLNMGYEEKYRVFEIEV